MDKSLEAYIADLEQAILIIKSNMYKFEDIESNLLELALSNLKDKSSSLEWKIRRSGGNDD